QWETAYGKAYEIDVSSDASTWTKVYSTTLGAGGTDDITFPAAAGRYVRMYGTQRGTRWGYSLWEFGVYGTPLPSTGNIARGKAATASSLASSSYPAANAVDGAISTSWSSQASDPQWISVDLGSSFSLNRVILKWDAAYPKAYQVQVSPDASSWTTV